VTLEGIVWHETEGGVLVVNVTWRGKTYVGTLIDCTKHDWAPPRFCDSPTEELDSRTPKGRETRSSVHSKLRNGGAKGRGGRTSTATATSGAALNATATIVSTAVSSNTPSTSPTAFLVPRPEKRKSKDESPSPVNGNNSLNGNNVLPGQGTAGVASVGAQLVKKPKTVASPCAISPVLLECPEQDCSKKYKHANGLKYHQSHAHGVITTIDEDSSSQAPDSPKPRPSSPAVPAPAPTANSSTVATAVTPKPDTPITGTVTATTTTQSSSTVTNNNPNQNAINSTNDSSQNSATAATKNDPNSNLRKSPINLLPNHSSSDSNSNSNSNSSTSNSAPPTNPVPSAGVATAANKTTSLPESQQMIGGITTTPTRTADPQQQQKVKPGVLRFGPLPIDQPQQATTPNQMLYPPTAVNQVNLISNNQKAQNLNSKQKKNRKSPGPEFENVSNRADDVRSPAYSDISDEYTDSTQTVEQDLSGEFYF
jgi:hypothetical protein